MSNREHTTRTVDRARATIRTVNDERLIQFINQVGGTTEVIVMDDDANIETRVTVSQVDLLHAIELVAS